jgi:hypothetical protein
MDVKSSQILTAPVDAPDPVLNVVPDTTAPLKPGKYVFQLVVTDDIGQKSQPAQFVVEVRSAPTVDIGGPTVVAFNQPIPLTAKAVTTGAIKTYSWSVRLG